MWEDIAHTVVRDVVVPIIGIGGAWVTYQLGKLLKRLMEKQQNALVKAAARSAVRWVEQRLVEATGSTKFKAAFDRLQAKFKWLPADEIEQAIEEAVHNLNAGLTGAAE